MLSKLSIDNYALIDEAKIDFNSGFTVITGETGAGKSIMLDALSLIMGARADSKAMGSKDRKTVVEAVFSTPHKSLQPILDSLDIDWDEEELILRREITPAGKSRGFINDTPVNLSAMSSVSDKLIDIHSQHRNSFLNEPHAQLQIIDAYGKTESFLKSYQKVFKKYVFLRNRIKKIKENIGQAKENREFLTFRLEQLDKLKPQIGELEKLEREAEILSDADQIKSGLAEAGALLSGSGNSALKFLQNASSVLDGIDFDLLDPKSTDNLTDRVAALKIELRDIADTVEGYEEKISANPERLEIVQKRIEKIYEALKRFKVKDESELVELHRNLKEELAVLDGGDENVSELEIQLKTLAKELKDEADLLTGARTRAAKSFSNIIEERISPLGMPNVRFKVEIEKGKMSAEGQDIIVFYCSFNKNHPMQPVAEIASGGEIARVMLGIKSLMAETMHLPTVIFDEIDTGVSGEIAHKMGKMMQEMSADLQVMAVTHLPQVAAVGTNHLKVYKKDNDDKTVSHIRRLSPEERVEEIAGMLSGNTINDVAIQNAKVLLQSI